MRRMVVGEGEEGEVGKARDGGLRGRKLWEGK